MKKFHFQTDPIDIASVYSEVGQKVDGAIVSFIGCPRMKSNDREVTHLEYEIYEEMAESELGKIIDEAMKRWPITDCSVIHRHGRVLIGETSIIICASSPHRDEAFQAVHFIIDTIKKTVPVWKKEFYTDGSMWISDRM
jgi:molybdopterin synthase catalytic subunit